MLTILQGDVLTKLREMPDESVHCCCTSPPYWGLRDYGTAQWEGGDDGCDHSGGERRCDKPGRNDKQSTHKGTASDRIEWDCIQCGAKRIDSQLGLEKTPEEYVAKMVEVFREVRRVLRKDGTLWLNMGDSYASAFACDRRSVVGNGSPDENCKRPNRLGSGLKEKDLCGIPWRLALALQADGAASPDHMRAISRIITAVTASYDTREEWPNKILAEVESLEREWIDAHEGAWWLRSDIIWHKPNPMPESCTDRPTKSHEYLFLLTKSANYFYDAEAIKERGVIPEGTLGAKGSEERFGMNGVNSRPPEYKLYDGTRNKRSVWTVATAPYPEAHFATYPPDLIKPCILAGTSAKGCCAKCGAPWERVVENTVAPYGPLTPKQANGLENGVSIVQSRGPGWRKRQQSSSAYVGWQPTCLCCEEVPFEISDPSLLCVPCTVLDPFAGSGTTGQVALELGRKAILIELNPKYVELIKRRCDVTPGLALA